MPLLGQAAVAMWWTIRPEHRKEFGDWHSHEHFPERMSIPGFCRGSRWYADDGAFFVLYELEHYETLTSDGYLSRLNAPTPWSQKMMPQHLGMTRSQCRVAASFGGGIANCLTTIRLSPRAGSETNLRHWLAESLAGIPAKPGLAGAHVLVTDTPAVASLTTEQRIRGSDRTADWIVLVSGYEPESVAETVAATSSARAFRDAVADNFVQGQYTLSLAMTPQDFVRNVAD